jgi:RNA polymerase sigma factor (sigma-70 family)
LVEPGAAQEVVVGAPGSLERELALALPRLRAHLARRGGDADDLAQDAAARALRGRATYDATRGGLWPWLRRIGDRVRFDHLRREREAPELRADLEPVAPGASSEHDDLTAERADALRIVAALPPRERDVLMRFHVDGESIAAIAEALGVPVGTVKSDLSRARRRLAEWHGPRAQETLNVRRRDG